MKDIWPKLIQVFIYLIQAEKTTSEKYLMTIFDNNDNKVYIKMN